MRRIRPPALFELRAQVAACKGANAVDSHHTPFSGSPLFSKQVRPARPVDIPKWSAWQDLHLQPFRLERNASALGYTRWCPRSGLHRHCAAF